jgi:predicted O-methyltransferase YrrM
LLRCKSHLNRGSLAVALALSNDGRIVACDSSVEWASIALRYWTEAGVANKIDLRLGPAIDSLDALITEGRSNSFDFVFIDADKSNYWNYFERALRLTRVSGLITIDNTLWSGKVADSDNHEMETEVIRTFNEKLFRDTRVDLSLVPIGDGLTLARKLR